MTLGPVDSISSSPSRYSSSIISVPSTSETLQCLGISVMSVLTKPIGFNSMTMLQPSTLRVIDCKTVLTTAGYIEVFSQEESCPEPGYQSSARRTFGWSRPPTRRGEHSSAAQAGGLPPSVLHVPLEGFYDPLREFGETDPAARWLKYCAGLPKAGEVPVVSPLSVGTIMDKRTRHPAG